LFLFTTQEPLKKKKKVVPPLRVELEGARENIISVSELLDLIEEAGSFRKGLSVIVTDTISGEVKTYNSMREVTRETTGIDNKGIKDKAESSKLYLFLYNL
jgi:hypothetical protein